MAVRLSPEVAAGVRPAPAGLALGLDPGVAVHRSKGQEWKHRQTPNTLDSFFKLIVCKRKFYMIKFFANMFNL